MYFIATNGRVFKERPENRNVPRLDIENNRFESKEEAWEVSEELEAQHPRIFYGKPSSKIGLIADANGDSTAAYRKRT